MFEFSEKKNSAEFFFTSCVSFGIQVRVQEEAQRRKLDDTEASRRNLEAAASSSIILIYYYVILLLPGVRPFKLLLCLLRFSLFFRILSFHF